MGTIVNDRPMRRTKRVHSQVHQPLNPLPGCEGTGAGPMIPFEMVRLPDGSRSEEHTSELQSPYVISYAVFCLKKKKRDNATPAKIIHRLDEIRALPPHST